MIKCTRQRENAIRDFLKKVIAVAMCLAALIVFSYMLYSYTTQVLILSAIFGGIILLVVFAMWLDGSINLCKKYK